MPTDYRVSQGQLTARALFSEPETGIVNDLPGLSRQLLRHLDQAGLQLSDMKMEWGDYTLSEVFLRCYLFNFRATLFVRPERVEVTANFPGAGSEQISAAFLGALAAVKEHLPASKFRAYSTDIGMHGVVGEGSARTFVERFIQNPPSLGPALGAGCVFYFGAESERLSSTLTLDLSAQLEGGLFVRSLTHWEGSKVGAADLPRVGAAHLDRNLEVLGLRLSSGA